MVVRSLLTGPVLAANSNRTAKTSRVPSLVLRKNFKRPCGNTGAFLLCARHEDGLEVKVLWGSWSQRLRVNRKVTGREEALKEAGNEAARQRTGTG